MSTAYKINACTIKVHKHARIFFDPMEFIWNSIIPDGLKTLIVCGSYAYHVVQDVLDNVHDVLDNVHDVLDKVNKSKIFELFSFWCELWSDVYTAGKVEIIFHNSTDITQKYDQSVVYSVPAGYLPRYWLSPLIHHMVICLLYMMILHTIIFCFSCCCRARRN
jgi:hypothetical protein